MLPEHVQNSPTWVVRQTCGCHGSTTRRSIMRDLFAVGGRSLTWGGWSPELLDVELTAWPPSARADLRARYFADASRQIGVKETNDFIYGPLHTGFANSSMMG